MKKYLLAALCCTVWSLPAQAEHFHTLACNHQFSDDQGSLTSLSYETISNNTFNVGSTSGGGMKFILNNLGGVEVGTDAYRGFTAAAALFSKVFTDDITIRLDVQFSQLAPNVLGSTGSTTNTGSYATARAALSADARTAYDALAVANLTNSAALTFVSNEPPLSGAIDSRTRFLDNNNSFDNLNIQFNTAQLKALGLTPTYAANNPNGRDGSISFSNQFNWDFDRSDGITAGAFDFVGVAAHEIGHALGFRSGVDLADANALPYRAPPGARGLNNIAWGTVHDLYRYGTFDGQTVLDWSVNSPSCHSITGGATCTGGLSTGRSTGDGRQASHWKDDAITNNLIGLMDPTATGFGGTRPFQQFTRADYIAFDVMGFDLNLGAVPEPSTWAMLIIGFGFVGASARRARRVRTTATVA